MTDGQLKPVLLTVGDVAHVLRISTRQVYRLLSSGHLPPASVNLGLKKRGRRWRRDELLAWVRADCPKADAWAAFRNRE